MLDDFFIRKIIKMIILLKLQHLFCDHTNIIYYNFIKYTLLNKECLGTILSVVINAAIKWIKPYKRKSSFNFPLGFVVFGGSFLFSNKYENSENSLFRLIYLIPTKKILFYLITK